MRLADTKMTRRICEALIGAGACDAFNVDRGIMVASLDSVLDVIKWFNKIKRATRFIRYWHTT